MMLSTNKKASKAEQLLSDHEVFHLEEQSKHEKKEQTLAEQNQYTSTICYTIPTKLCYTFLEAAKASVEPFLNVFFLSIGLTIGEACLITSLRILSATICQPCWKSICGQKSRRSIATFWIMCLITSSLVFPIPWITETSNQVSLTECFSKETLINDNHMDISTNCQNSSNSSTHSLMFFVMLSMNVAGGVFSGSLPLHINEIANNVMHSHPSNLDLSSQQLFGVVGKAFGAFFGGVAGESYDDSSYKGNFCVFLPTMGLLLVSSVFLFHQIRRIPLIQPKHYPCIQTIQGSRADNIENILLLASIVFVGIADGLQTFFVLVYLEEKLHASKFVMGLSIGVSQITIMVMMGFGAFNGNKLPQNNFIMLFTLGLGCYSLQMFFMSIITNAWIVLPVQFLYGVGYSIYWTCLLDYYKTKSRKDISYSHSTLLQFLHQGVGFITANILGGIFYPILGGEKFFRRFSLVYLSLTIISILYYLFKCLFKRNMTN